MMKNTLPYFMKDRSMTNKPFTLGAFFILLSLVISSCGKNDFERELGQVAAFAEAVNAGAKPLALSSLMPSSEMDEFFELAKAEAERFGVSVSREPALLTTDLFSEQLTANKEVILLYQGSTLAAYQGIKADKDSLIATGAYEGAQRMDIARRFGRLLGYAPTYINQLLKENTDFRSLNDFGIQATNVFLYYQDLEKATEFYRGTLGLRLVETYDNASVFQVAQQSLLVLVDEAKGMHSAQEEKSVAIAFLTNDLPNWYAYLLEEEVEIKYSYKPKEGGPHDGFVAVDPEGYLLEFETFKTHKENEPFKVLLTENIEEATSVSFNGKTLGFHGTITWLYHKDLLALQNFYEDVLGLSLVADQGWTKIYQGSKTGFIGLVDERRGMNDYADEKAVNMSFVLDDLEGWFDYVKQSEVMPFRNPEISPGPSERYKSFVAFGPELYFYEFDHFRDLKFDQ